MKITKVEYPTKLEEINDVLDDNIDVFVEMDNGWHFTVTVCTPNFYISQMDKEHVNFVGAPPDIIVRELTDNNIQEALESFCEDDGYWMKLYFLASMLDTLEVNQIMNDMMNSIKRTNDFIINL